MKRILPPAAAYAGAVLVAGVVLGAIRTLWLAPLTGALAAVAMELPAILALGWAIAGLVLRAWPLPRVPARLAMGGVAFVLLMAGEAALAMALGRSPAEWVAGMGTPAGALGLAGQVVFALIPALRR